MSNEVRNEELTALSLRTVGKDWVEDINYGGSPSAHSSHATLIAELAVERAKVKKLREALEYGLTKLDDPRVEIRSNKEMALAIEESFRRLRAALAETAE